MNRTVGWVVGAIVVVALIVVGIMWKQGKIGAKAGYQAVFLTNGQVYFGKVSNERSNPVVLSDIYYLRVQRQLQPKPEGEEANQSDQTKTQIQLIKLGNELHGPQDEMRINSDQILYIEDLKEDKNDKGEYKSTIRKLIADFKARGDQPASPSPAAS